MSRLINRAENWERVYEAFQQVNFAAWDYETVKQSLIDYLKLYYPEDFNNFIESDELVALLELFAYVAELSAYRFDLNAHENFISTAERKESVLRLAKLLSYKADRNIPARGLVKLTSVTTTERVFDSNGLDLSNRTIRWNDPNNPNWKEQFILVMNRVLDQDFGTVTPSDRVQVQDVLFERYKFLNNPLATNTLRYTITVSDQQFPMELVSSDVNEFGPIETRPEKDLQLGVLYLNDGLGDSSENTGFFMFTKQGELQRTVTFFDGITPNQTFDVDIPNTNDIDIWINNIDEQTDEIIVDPNDFDATVREGVWEEVDTVFGQNIVFNNLESRNKYEIETLDNDEFRVIFGDGKFANIPSGKFEIWSRTSANTDLPIPTTAIQNISNAFTYQDAENKEQTFSFSISLLTPIQNAAPSEDIEQIRRIAPSVYYTQDRMVNGRDYNEYMLQDNSILKLRAINRTFAGDSKYIAWNDPSEYYDNVKIFGDDGVVYFRTVDNINFAIADSDLPPDAGDLINALIDNHIEPLLITPDFFTRFILSGVNPGSIRTEFTASERVLISTELNNIIGGGDVFFEYSTIDNVWSVTTVSSDAWIRVFNEPTQWVIEYDSRRLIFHSDETKFWNTNQNDPVITSDTLNTNLDTVVVLKANLGSDGNILPRNYDFDVLGQVPIDQGEDIGLPSIHDLFVVPDDEDENGFPDNPDLAYLIAPDDYVYFNRIDNNSPWVFQTVDQPIDVVAEWQAEEDEGLPEDDRLWKRESGVEGINFAWFHRTPRYHLIDPAASNIIDMYIITRGYARNLRLWLNNQLAAEPEAPTPFQLRSDYQYLLENKMISDTVILHPGNIKVLFGEKAQPQLRGIIKVVRSPDRSLSDNQIKTSIVNIVNEFFDISTWEFGETFYFSELAAFIHSRLPVAIDSVVLVPTFNLNEFGDLYQVFAREDEIIQANITVNEVQIVQSLDSRTLRQD